MCVDWAAEVSETRGNGPRAYREIHGAGMNGLGVKDYSSDVDSARLVHTFWALACALDIDVWFEFVYSEANIADWPSRGRMDLGATEVRPVSIPPSDVRGSVGDALAFASEVPGPPAKRARHR